MRACSQMSMRHGSHFPCIAQCNIRFADDKTLQHPPMETSDFLCDMHNIANRE